MKAPRRFGLAAGLCAAAVALLVLAAAVSLPYWAPWLGFTEGPSSSDVAALQARLTALEGMVADLSNRPAPAGGGGAHGADADRLAALNGQITSLKDANAKLAADAAALHQQVDALVQQTRKNDAEEARRAALVIAVGQLEEALAHDTAYRRPLDDVAALGNGDADVTRAVATLQTHAATGIPTFAELESMYDEASVAAARAALAPTRPGLLGTVLARLESLVVIRRTDARASGADAVLARADALIKTGDLAGAVAALDTLQDGPARAMAPWLADAHARLDAEAALGVLTSQAIGRLGTGKS